MRSFDLGEYGKIRVVELNTGLTDMSGSHRGKYIPWLFLDDVLKALNLTSANYYCLLTEFDRDKIINMYIISMNLAVTLISKTGVASLCSEVDRQLARNFKNALYSGIFSRYTGAI